MMKNFLGAAIGLLAGLWTFGSAALAGECLYHQPDWRPDGTMTATPDAKRELRLVSIGLDERGGFRVNMVSRNNIRGDADWMLPGMVEQLAAKMGAAGARHKAFKAGGTPFDMVLDQDTEIIFLLEPAAWRWADAAADKFFLKERNKDGVRQRHNPFTAARSIAE